MRTLAFIDASNLFYGGEKSLGWRIDYQKLLYYLCEKYEVKVAYYFGGVEVGDFPYDYQKYDSVPLDRLYQYFMDGMYTEFPEIWRLRFFLKLQRFGYRMLLKPVKSYVQEDGTPRKKANCDVEMAFFLMKEKSNYDRAVVLSGDGDFLPILKHIQAEGKNVIVLARGDRTAREIKQFAGGTFRDFIRLRSRIEFL